MEYGNFSLYIQELWKQHHIFIEINIGYIPYT